MDDEDFGYRPISDEDRKRLCAQPQHQNFLKELDRIFAYCHVQNKLVKTIDSAMSRNKYWLRCKRKHGYASKFATTYIVHR